jgi:hypothetical protein
MEYDRLKQSYRFKNDTTTMPAKSNDAVAFEYLQRDLADKGFMNVGGPRKSFGPWNLPQLQFHGPEDPSRENCDACRVQGHECEPQEDVPEIGYVNGCKECFEVFGRPCSWTTGIRSGLDGTQTGRLTGPSYAWATKILVRQWEALATREIPPSKRIAEEDFEMDDGMEEYDDFEVNVE